MRTLRLLALAIPFVVAFTLSAPSIWAAEPYPSRPVRVIVSFAPGGAADFIGRMMSPQLSEQMGRQFVVENRAGASGAIGADLVAKAVPDGHTLLLAESGLTIIAGLMKGLPFDVLRDFTPVTQITRSAQVLVVSPALNVSTLADFIALARANPTKFNYGSAGNGSPNHLASELFKIAARAPVTHVPFKGSGLATAALLGNQVQVQLTTISTVLPHINSGKVRPLAVTTDGRRSSALPDVPSFVEAGYPGLGAVYTWAGLAGPAGLPRDIVGRLHAEVGKALQVTALRERYVGEGAEPVGSSPDEFSNYWRNEVKLWGEVIKTAGITAD